MKFLITIIKADGRRSYTAIGDRNAIIDAAYDAGALGVSVRPL